MRIADVILLYKTRYIIIEEKRRSKFGQSVKTNLNLKYNIVISENSSLNSYVEHHPLLFPLWRDIHPLSARTADFRRLQ
jgi:hypothetical protein